MSDDNNKRKRKRILRKLTPVNIKPSMDEKTIEIDDEILQKIGRIADEKKIKAYCVGGYVRDYYLGLERRDFDITVIGDPIYFANLLAARFNTKAVIYPRFRTAMLPVGEYKIEIVGTRKETYQPNSRKPIVTIGTLKDDLIRRDFTINTLAASLNQENFGQVIDLFGGLEDLKNKILKTPIDPFVTFNDDPLRMLRAARFASQLNFSVHKRIIQAMKELAERIEIISVERIADEFLKILATPKPSVGISILYETDLLKYIFPELHYLAGEESREAGGRIYKHKDILLHSLKVLDNVATQSDNLWLRFAALIHDIGKTATKRFSPEFGWSFHGHEEVGANAVHKIFENLRLPFEHQEYVEKLVRLHQRPMALVDEEVTDSAIRRLAFQAGDALEDLFILCKADITTNNPDLSQKYLNNYDIVARKVVEVQEKDKLREFQSPVRGDEIMQICNLQPSKVVGFLKSKIEEAILDGIIPNEYEPAREYFLQNKDKWLEEFHLANSGNLSH